MPPQLPNADPLVQIIGTETMANVIINDAEACALLDSGATADLMTLAYAKARSFDIRPVAYLFVVRGLVCTLLVALGNAVRVSGDYFRVLHSITVKYN